MTLTAAADRLGCHVETLRRRVRSGDLVVDRGAHGRYYVHSEDLAELDRIRRPRRRQWGPEEIAAAWTAFESLLTEPIGFAGWQRYRMLASLQEPATDIHLFRVLGVYAFREAGLNLEETAEQLGISVRQVQRIRERPLADGLAKALQRRQSLERGKVRAGARSIVRELQRSLAAAGFRTARRDPHSSQSGARAGVPARVSVVRELDRDQVRALEANGISPKQIAAIRVVGIGRDELNELILRGVPEPSEPATHLDPIV